MTAELNIEDPKYPLLAASLLDRHERNDAEANITSAIRDFLAETRLASREEMVEENPPSEGSRLAVDLTALDTFIEVKRRIGTAAAGQPNPEYVDQLDEYLEQSAKSGRGVRMGVLTDGKYWLLRWPDAGPARTARPYLFTLDDPQGWLPLHNWLRDTALLSLENIPPAAEAIAEHFGPGSPSYQRDIAALTSLYRQHSHLETIRVKRALWHDLLRTALGEIARSDEQMDDLFIRHTYLSTVVGMAVQASFGLDIRQLAESDPADLLHGRRFQQDTGLQGVLESDFFAWPAEVGDQSMLKTLARRVARFDWKEAPPNIAATLYETVIPPEERRQLGEYYTPAWLARAMVKELITDPLRQRVLDPACGSGAFLTEAVAHFIAAAEAAGWDPPDILGRLRVSVTGIDVHPVAAHLARSAWTLAARPTINAAQQAGFSSSLSVPVYLGDALQLRFRSGDLFAEGQVTIDVQDENGTQLVFPVSLVDRAEDFDALMSDVAYAIERGQDPLLALDDNGITNPAERLTLEATIGEMRKLHNEGRDHIWAYYTRNLVRPVALSRAKVDVIIGNPPWINYNQTADVLRDELENLSKGRYSIWAGGRYATHQDVAGLFFTRSVELYLRPGGEIGFVMPHSALQAGQYSKWRTGQWNSPPVGRGKNRRSEFRLSVMLGHRPAWDLERLEPNTFFPVPACVVFGRSTGQKSITAPLAGSVQRWRGKAGADDVTREFVRITDTGVVGDSPYASLSRNGATIFPRVLFFVNETENAAIIQAGQTITVNPRRGSLDKKPWNGLDLASISGQTIERSHLFDVHLGETVAPYVTLEPLRALLPLKQGEYSIPADKEGVGGIHLGALDRRMRERWQAVSGLWNDNKELVNRLNLLGRVNYHGELSSQLEWQLDHEARPVRIVYTSSGQPTAAILEDDTTLVENVLFWLCCKNANEANYLLAIINSDTLATAVNKYTVPNWAGNTRHLHKHLWKLPIPEYDPAIALHGELAGAGAAAATGAAAKLAELRQQRGEHLSVTIARRELRAWLRASPEGAAVESAVARLLAGA